MIHLIHMQLARMGIPMVISLEMPKQPIRTDMSTQDSLRVLDKQTQPVATLSSEKYDERNDVVNYLINEAKETRKLIQHKPHRESELVTVAITLEILANNIDMGIHSKVSL